MGYLNETTNTLIQCHADLTLLKGQPSDVILGSDATDVVNVCYLFTNQSYTDDDDTL
jgi:hypothetical protein